MFVYDVVKQFPKSELYGTVSQLCRAAVSVMLNYVEGFARKRIKVKLQFYETSYGSAKECKYLLFLAFERRWLEEIQYRKGLEYIEEICAMLWSMISRIENEIKEEA